MKKIVRKFDGDNFVFYYHEQFVDMIEEGSSYYHMLKFADFVVNQRTNKLMKSRVPIEDLIDKAILQKDLFN